MKKIILLSLIVLNLSVHAQLNNRFYLGGNASLVQNVGAYCTNKSYAWRDVQQFLASSYDWGYTDSVLQLNQSAGLHTMITLKCTNPITPNDTIAGSPAWCFDQNLLSDNACAWFPKGTDTIQWKNFVDAIVDRYDGDTTNDMPGLIYPITEWHIIGQEWQRIWSTDQFLDTSCNALTKDTSLANTKKFVQLVNMTYDVIKNRQPNSEISLAGIDTRNQTEAFYDGYFSQATLCKSDCINPSESILVSGLDTSTKFLQTRRNTMYIFKNAKFDEMDVHEYGRWANIPDVVRWVKDSAQGKPVIFLEGGGPFCPACELIYHSVNDTDGRLPDFLVRDNASYVVYYFITGFAAGVKKMHWNPGPEYTDWGATFGDLDLRSINKIKKPSFYVYQWLAKSLFSNALADTVIRIPDSNPDLYHYQVQSSAADTVIDVAWSTNATDSIILNGIGTLYTYDIPIACNSLYPTECDSVFPINSYSVSGSHTIALNDGVPVFYNWNNAIGIDNNITAKNNSVNLFPNPATNILNVSFELLNSSNIKIEILDISGRTVTNYNMQNLQVGHNNLEFDINNLNAGIYLCRLTIEGETITKRFIKQ